MVRPVRLLLLLGYIAGFLGLAGLLLPKEVKLNNQLTLRFFDLRNTLLPQQVQYADISGLRKTFEEEEAEMAAAPDTSAKGAMAAVPADTARQEVLEDRYRIQFPEGQDTLLYTFFRSLELIRQKDTLVRVLHYGDSQIEGDRITAFLRSKMQEKFGGCGVGLVPLLDPLGNRTSIVIRSDAPWKKFAAYGAEFRKSSPRNYGIMGSFFQYSFAYPVAAKSDSLSPVPDTAAQRKPVYALKKWQSVSVDLLPAPQARSRSSRFQNLKLLYRNRETPFELSIGSARGVVEKLSLDTARQARLLQYPVNEQFRELHLTFGSSKSPELYGVALDCKSGVAIDNMPFRGSSGIEFTRMNKDLLRQQLRALNVRCIILQFGVNVVPYVTSDYSFYEKQFYTQLRLFKELLPDVSILVVGVSDMSRKEGETYASYPNIEKIRDAQRNAAFKAGCAFWDLYTAMGGKDSMPSWVNATPALANKDFTHFTPKGARIVSEMLYKALMSEHDKYSHLKYHGEQLGKVKAPATNVRG